MENSDTKREMYLELLRVAQNTRYPVYNVNTGIVPSSITTYLEYLIHLLKENEKK